MFFNINSLFYHSVFFIMILSLVVYHHLINYPNEVLLAFYYNQIILFIKIFIEFFIIYFIS
jgi:hypothetical protein